MEYHFTAIFQKSGDWWIGWVEELPGANTQGRTLEEARENMQEAIRMMLDDEEAFEPDTTPDGEIIREEIVVTV